ncbi:MAG TPA: response regulator transcription factor [Chthoniobacteraceae bacterium]|nr:response regulator transcription factor [Chthoniobacteraceae bacterium]
MRKRIVIVDAHESIRDMLVSVLQREPDYAVVGRTGSGLKAVELCRMLQPDVVILDLMLPELSGSEVIRRAQASARATRVLVYTGTFDRALIIEALRCRPAGFVDKADPLDTLKEAIAVVAAGGNYFAARASGFLRESRMNAGIDSSLTNREREVLQLIAEGSSSKEISKRLGLSCKTVENHRSRLMNKIDVHEVAGLTRYAVRHGIVAA